ncbi:MAG: hypothetical protein EPN46_08015 [Candidimonas sp.]|nr:MAG: hypothetical protein EPN77_09775 [Candidimonas sp.]TAM25304.1 MAG: hypothetical protein EPN62_04420 [Candidimonas sp.]TAM76771.1 MAG: hypothetical protein EPN46_08015 [Candidimonas sp.]
MPGPSAEERSALFEAIGPLPLRGQAWPTWIKIMAWVVLLIIAMQITRAATGPHVHGVNPLIAGSILVCFMVLLVVARFMLISETRITCNGIEQSWITRRQVIWDDIQFAKFVPLITSKRLVCFTRRGRQVVFQGGTRELQIAFARIAQAYRRQR